MTDSDHGIGERVSEGYRRTPPLDPRGMREVMRAVRAARPPRKSGSFNWWTEPLSLRISPLAAAAALALVCAGAWSAARWSRPAPSPASAPSATTAQVVQFVFTAPGASRVALAGDFNDWNPEATPMRRVQAAGGTQEVWTVSVPVSPGRHVYSFVLDGDRWVADPSAPLAPDDGFGKQGSVLVVGSVGSI